MPKNAGVHFFFFFFKLRTKVRVPLLEMIMHVFFGVPLCNLCYFITHF